MSTASMLHLQIFLLLSDVGCNLDISTWGSALVRIHQWGVCVCVCMGDRVGGVARGEVRWWGLDLLPVDGGELR